jgi:hypothetical protein
MYMDFFVGGYFLVQAAQPPEWIDKTLLPDKIWTVSSCICEIYPDSWIFPWVETSRQEYQKLLQLDEERFQALQAWADDLMLREELGWPNIFLNIKTARQFYSQYLTHLPNIKLLSTALAEPYWSEFIAKHEPTHEVGESEIAKKLREKQAVEKLAIRRGFEILGAEYGAQFHSFICNSLEKNYHQQLNITLNQNGLIEDYADAIKATTYTNLDEVGAEPVLWQPWLISEYPLQL